MKNLSLGVILAACLASSSLGFSAPQPQQRRPQQISSSVPFSSNKKSTSPTQLNAFFEGLPGGGPKKQAETAQEQFPPVVIDKDFRLAAIFLVTGLLLDQIPWIQLTLGPIVTLLGILFLVQTIRLDFVCDTTAFELKTQGTEMEDNIVVGGKNRWDYNKFVNYEFFPKDWIGTPQGPILVYFKETQTPEEFWSTGPGEKANSEDALAKGAKVSTVRYMSYFLPISFILSSMWYRRHENPRLTFPNANITFRFELNFMLSLDKFTSFRRSSTPSNSRPSGNVEVSQSSKRSVKKNESLWITAHKHIAYSTQATNKSITNN